MLAFRTCVLAGTAVALTGCGGASSDSTDDGAMNAPSAPAAPGPDAASASATPGPDAAPAPSPIGSDVGPHPTYCDELLPSISLADDGLPDIALHKLVAPHCIDFGFLANCSYDTATDTTTCSTKMGGANLESFDTISVRWSANLQGTAFGNRAGQSAVALGSLSGVQWSQAGIFYFDVTSEASWKMFVPTSSYGFNHGRCHVMDKSTNGVQLCGPE